MPLAHPPRDHNEHTAEGRQRDKARERGCHQDDGEQGQRVHHPGYRRAPAGADIGRGARDGTGRGDPAEPRTNEVCQPLPNQLLIGIVPACDHSIGHHGREERFDRAQHCNRKGGQDQRLDA